MCNIIIGHNQIIDTEYECEFLQELFAITLLLSEEINNTGEETTRQKMGLTEMELFSEMLTLGSWTDH